MNKKEAVNARLLAVARMSTIFGQRKIHQLSHAEYTDYLCWLQIMVNVERQRVVQLGVKNTLTPAVDIEEAVAAG